MARESAARKEDIGEGCSGHAPSANRFQVARSCRLFNYQIMSSGGVRNNAQLCGNVSAQSSREEMVWIKKAKVVIVLEKFNQPTSKL